jgi:hypothetical protein
MATRGSNNFEEENKIFIAIFVGINFFRGKQKN